VNVLQEVAHPDGGVIAKVRIANESPRLGSLRLRTRLAKHSGGFRANRTAGNIAAGFLPTVWPFEAGPSPPALFDVNVLGTILVSQAAIPHFRHTGRSVVNMSSIVSAGMRVVAIVCLPGLSICSKLHPRLAPLMSTPPRPTKQPQRKPRNNPLRTRRAARGPPSLCGSARPHHQHTANRRALPRACSSAQLSRIHGPRLTKNPRPRPAASVPPV
jgi:hypothetical protein